MNRLRFINIFGFLTILLFIILSCTDNQPVDDQQYKGWVVGHAESGYGTILSTSNDGMTWTRQGSQSQAAGVDLYDIHSLDQNTVWAVGGIFQGYGLILHSTNGGVDWQRQGTSAQIPNVRIYAIHAVDELNIWAAGDNNTLLASSNGGITWSVVNTASFPPATYYSITSFGTKSLWVVGAAADTAFSDTVGIVLYSNDGGVNWLRQGVGYQFPRKFFDVSAGNDSIVFIAGTNSVYKTTNGGMVWQNVLDVPGRNINGICAVDVENIWAVGDYDGIYHSQTGGVSWETIHPSLTGFRLMGVTVADVNRVWIVGAPSSGTGKGTIIYSRNAGNTWFIESFPVEAGFRRISFASARR
jgi:photosystem II stability/assembly factor-like uncharacterized protein